MTNYDRLIICINSLHYLQEKTYKVVIIDEIETLLNKWFDNDTLKESKLICWTVFLNVLRKAEKVIFLDAFTSKMTLNFIKSLNEQNEYKIVERINQQSTREIEFIKNLSHWLKDIVNTMNEGKKVFIFYPLKDGNHKLPSMQELHHIIQAQTGKMNGVFYNADVGCKTLKGLDNVNEAWSNADFVITNSKITVGVNYDYDLNHFDNVYLCVADFSSARDIIQVSYRCRQLISNQIKICYLDSYNKKTAFNDDSCLVGFCPVYQSLIEDIRIEKEAPLKQSILHFCNLANYKVKAGETALEGELEAYYKKIFDDTTLGYNYETIPIITTEQCQDLQFKIFEDTATLDDKIAIKKYFYNNQFVNNPSLECMQIGWDKRYDVFFKRVGELTDNDDNIFEKIRLFNKWESVFPSDIDFNKVKLNDELINLIFDKPTKEEEIISPTFQRFLFKDLKKNSSHKCIVKSMYNTRFGKNIVGSVVDKSNNSKMTIKDEVRDMYEFCLTHQFRYLSLIHI